MEYRKINEENYILLSHIETRFGDPISSICLNANFCIIGTMLGRLILFNLRNSKQTTLYDGADEEIINISFSTINNKTSNDFYFCVGDTNIIKYTLKPNLLDKSNPIPSQVICIDNYTDEYLHIKDCDNAIVFLSKDNYFTVAIEQIKKKPMILNATTSQYIVKNLETFETIEKGEIVTTNYVVPFDFDGKLFLLLEFVTNVERIICAFNVFTQKSWKHLLKKSFGVINHCKLLENNGIFLVRNLSSCEFRIMDKDFSLIHSFKHIGDEVISCDLFYKIIRKSIKSRPMVIHKENEIDIFKYNKEEFSKNNNETERKSQNNKNEASDGDIKFDSSNEKSNENFMEDNIDNNNDDNKGDENKKINSIVENNDSEVKANSLINIILLDIDGNINFYNEKKLLTLFNINKIKEVDKIMGERGLFSLGYPYIIKFYFPYLAVSTDYGCYIFQIKNL